LMKNLASSESLTGDQKENLNKMIEAFASAAKNTDLSSVAEAFLKKIKEKPKSDADAKKLQNANKIEFEARAAKAKKEIEIREKTNAMLIKLQSDTEAVYRRYNNSIEDFISSVETASQMLEAAGQFRSEYLSEAGFSKDVTDPVKEKNIVNKSNADLTVGIYKSQQATSQSFQEGVDSLLSGIEADTAKAGVGQSPGDQAGELSKIKLAITKALLPVQEMITGGNYEGAKSKTQEVFNQLKPEERTAVGEGNIASAVKQLNSGIDQGARSQDLLVKNSQKDLAIQAQQLIFQKATSKLAQAQNFGGSASESLDPTGNKGGAFDTAMEALGNLRVFGYNQESLKLGKDQQVAGGDRNTLGLNGQKPSKSTTSDVLKFYKSMSDLYGGSVMSTESKDFQAIVQAQKDVLLEQKRALETGGAGVVDPGVFERINSTLATLGGSDQVAKLKVLKETGAVNVSGKNMLDEAIKGYTDGAFAGLDPDLKKAFGETKDETAGVTLLLLADQKNQTTSLLQGQISQTNSLNGTLVQQPSQIAQAIGSILDKNRAETEKSVVDQKLQDVNQEIGSIESGTGVVGKMQENKNIASQAKQKIEELNPGFLSINQLEKLDEKTVDKYRVKANIGASPNVQASPMTTEQDKKDYKYARDLVTAFDNLEEIKQNYNLASDKETENKVLQTKKAELEKKKSGLATEQAEKNKSLETATLAVTAATAITNSPAAPTSAAPTSAAPTSAIPTPAASAQSPAGGALVPTQHVFTPQLSPEGQQAAIEEAQKNAIEKAEAQRDSLKKLRADMQASVSGKIIREQVAGTLLRESNSAPDLSSINEKMRGLHDESKVLNPAGYSVETIKKAKDNPELMERLGSKSEKGDWITDGESKYDRRGLRTAVTNLPEIERNKEERTSALGSINRKAELKAESDQAYESLPGLQAKIEEATAKFNKEQASPDRLSPKQREIASEIRSQSEEDQALESIKPDFMNKSVVTKGKDGKTTSRRATAKDVAKTPEEFRSLTQQENDYNSAKMNIAYERSSKSKQDAEKARKEAEFIKQNPEVASLQKKQAQERTSLAQGFSRKDEKGNATTGIRMGEENGYSGEEVAKFKVESAGLKAKHDVEMKEVMTRAKSGLSSATGLSQQAMMGQSVQPGSPAVTPSKNSPQWMQDSLNGKSSVVSSDLKTPRLTVGAEKTTQQVVTEKIKPQIDQKQNDKVKPDQRQDPTQVVSNILTTVNQIAAELQKQVSPTAADGGQSVASGGSGSVSVSAPVNFSINSTAGENKTEVANVADKIKTDLTAFLSSPEFLERVTTIAKNATGNTQPPKAIV